MTRYILFDIKGEVYEKQIKTEGFELPSNRIEYLDGIKGLACIVIMLGHFFAVYSYAEDFGIFKSDFFDFFFHFPFAFFLNAGNRWLFLFFVVSGFLLGMSKPKSLRALSEKFINRFLRLLLPIVGTSLIIVFIGKTVGFHNADTYALFTNNWFQYSFYNTPVRWLDVLIDPFKVLFTGNGVLNLPYWVIKDMFFSSLLIYFCGYLRTVFSKLEPIIAAAALVVSFFFLKDIAFACVCGMLAAWYGERINKLISSKAICAGILLFSLAMPLGMEKLAIRALKTDVFEKPIFIIIYWTAIMLFLPRFEFLKKLFSSKAAKFCGKISFGIYSLHWPLLCSLGSLVLIYFSGIMSGSGAFALTYVILVLISFAAAYGYNITVEKLAGRFQNKIMGLIKKHE